MLNSEYRPNPNGINGTNTYCRPCEYTQNRQRAKDKVQWIKDYKLGVKCTRCGYNTCSSALHFHHVDPSKKTKLSNRKSYRREWSLDRIKQEIAKCIVLCANCHAEEHDS